MNKDTIDYILSNIDRNDEGNLIIPLPWNNKVKDNLSKNFHLSKQILKSNFVKLNKNSDKMIMYDKVFKDQESENIIERIDDVATYLSENRDASFLPHMPIFKMNRETTKCRVVFLSNLCEKSNSKSVSHNQALLSGPNLNHKILNAILFLRFDRYLFTFDIKKAFLNIVLPEEDQNKLLFLWYRDIDQGDYSIIAYKNLRLSFGLRPSPCILMLALYYILLLDIERDNTDMIQLKREIFHSIYMDNGAFSCNSVSKLALVYELLPKIFSPYQFFLQQFCSNEQNLRTRIKIDFPTEDTESEVKLFGMLWNTKDDKLRPYPINLNVNADTKRLVLQTINSVYDVLNVYGPILNRARLFLQNLQLNSKLEWDSKLSVDLQREWKNIAKQANLCPVLEIDRFVGNKDDPYSLISFTDASKHMYGTVIYMKNERTNEIKFMLSKSRVVGSKIANKSIPSLEFQAITFGTEVLIELFGDLCGINTVCPITINNLYLFSDSMVALHWLQSYAVSFDKLQKLSVFIMNRLQKNDELCKIHPITYLFTEGVQNPADPVS